MVLSIRRMCGAHGAIRDDEIDSSAVLSAHRWYTHRLVSAPSIYTLDTLLASISGNVT